MSRITFVKISRYIKTNNSCGRSKAKHEANSFIWPKYVLNRKGHTDREIVDIEKKFK